MNPDPNQPVANPPSATPAPDPAVKPEPHHPVFGNPSARNPRGFDPADKFRHMQPRGGFSRNPASREHARGRHNG